jgi:hypothetical protein
MPVEGETMKQVTCLALIAALAAVMACAPEDEAPPQEPQSETASDQPITEEDFESGEPGAMEERSDDEQEEGDVSDETP